MTPEPASALFAGPFAFAMLSVQPGDLVLTGSPAGNGMHWGRLLPPGDVMEGSVTGLGGQRTRCVAEVAP